MPLIGSAEPCFFEACLAFPAPLVLTYAEWAYQISTENASEKLQFGSKHLVCRAAERHRATTERLDQKTVVIWKTVRVGLFVIHCDFLWRDTDRMEPASQRLVEPGMLAVLHT